jgi:hypothetical protein
MQLTAKKTETYDWLSYTSLVDFILYADGKQLPGHVTVDVNDLDKTLTLEVERLKTGYATYDENSKKVLFGRWFDPVDEAAIKAAILQELQ